MSITNEPNYNSIYSNLLKCEKKFFGSLSFEELDMCSRVAEIAKGKIPKPNIPINLTRDERKILISQIKQFQALNNKAIESLRNPNKIIQNPIALDSANKTYKSLHPELQKPLIPPEKTWEYQIERIGFEKEFVGIEKVIKDAPADVKELFSKPGFDNLVALAHLRRNRDTLAIWNVLAPAIGQKVPNLDCKNIDEYADKASKFFEWFAKNQGELSKVKHLDLSGLNLAYLPGEALGKLSGLQTINLSNNVLSDLPEEMKNLKNLTKLTLTTNHFVKIPNVIYKLPKLQVLDINKNKLKELSHEIDNLQHLTKLNLAENDLHKLPRELGNMPNLSNLNISSNPRIKKLPYEMMLMDVNLVQDKNPVQHFIDAKGIWVIPQGGGKLQLQEPTGHEIKLLETLKKLLPERNF